MGVSLKTVVDPHFSSNNGYGMSPYARFEPTDEGWRMALRLCEMLNDN